MNKFLAIVNTILFIGNMILIFSGPVPANVIFFTVFQLILAAIFWTLVINKKKDEEDNTDS